MPRQTHIAQVTVQLLCANINCLNFYILPKVVAGKVLVEGDIVYDGNNAITDSSGIVSVGGALHLLSFSQTVLHNGTHVKFINNTGR